MRAGLKHQWEAQISSSALLRLLGDRPDAPLSPAEPRWRQLWTQEVHDVVQECCQRLVRLSLEGFLAYLRYSFDRLECR